MQKVDLVIAALGVVALAATAIGVATYEDGSVDFDIVRHQSDYDAGALTLGASTPASAIVAVPNNATSSHVTVAFAYTGQAISGGSAVATVTVTGPDGTIDTTTESFAIAQGDNGGDLGTIELHSSMWADIPANFTAAADDVDQHLKAWDSDFTVEVSVESPTGALANLETFTYTASITGWFDTYSAQRHIIDAEAI